MVKRRTDKRSRAALAKMMDKRSQKLAVEDGPQQPEAETAKTIGTTM
jgi:hypothetical protein